jgi:uncharacterized cupredoxin-like copper-binding protein
MIAIPRRRLALVAGSLVLILAAACSAAPSSAPGSTQQLVVTGRDITFAQKQLTLKAGQPARLVFVNEGAIEHDVTIPGLAVGKSAEGHGSEEASHSMGALAPGTVHATAQPGDRVTVDFTPKAGTYEFACTIPGHKEAGMVGSLRVQ